MKIRTDFVTNSSSSSYVSIKYTDNVLSELLKEFSDVLSADEDIIESFSVDGDTVSFSIPEGWYGNHPKNENEAKGIVSSIIVGILGELSDAVESIEENHSEFENRGEELITRLNSLNKEELLAGCTSFEYSYSQNGNFEDPSLLYELEEYLVGDLKELNYSAEDYYIGSTTTYKDGEVKVHTKYEINSKTIVDFVMSDTVSNIETITEKKEEISDELNVDTVFGTVYFECRNASLREAIAYAGTVSFPFSADALDELPPEEAILKFFAISLVRDFLYLIEEQGEEKFFKFTYDTLPYLPHSLIYTFKTYVVKNPYYLGEFLNLILALFFALMINEHDCKISACLREDEDTSGLHSNFQKYLPYIGVKKEVCFYEPAGILAEALEEQLGKPDAECYTIDLEPFYECYYEATGVDLKKYLDPLITL